ncbi:MAG: FlgB family protein [Pseudomonadota bacterium]
MLEQPRLMQLASAMAEYAGARQRLIAENVANADTPGYTARDLPAFRAMLADAPFDLRRTRSAHMHVGDGAMGGMEVQVAAGEVAPNGNSVSIETEMMRAAEARQQHDMAIAVYKGALDLMRSALGRGR